MAKIIIIHIIDEEKVDKAYEEISSTLDYEQISHAIEMVEV